MDVLHISICSFSITLSLCSIVFCVMCLRHIHKH
nr:MAG TPA: hypothetical protein [Caudoviricetes sp.]